MAIVYDGSSGRGLNRTGLLASGTTATIMAWLYPTTLPSSGAYNNAFGEYQALGCSIFNSGGAKWNIGTQTTDDVGSAVTVNVWKHLALTTSAATTHTLYLDGVQDATSTGSANATRVIIGNYVDTGGVPQGDVSFNGRIACVKIYDAVLTADEIKLEMRSYVPVRLASLKAWYRFFDASDLGDYSGNGQTLTTVGTAPTSADGAPIAWSIMPTGLLIPAAAAGGGVTVDLSASPNSLALTSVDPTVVLGSLTVDLTASPNSMVLATVNPTVVLGSLTLDLTASPSVLALASVDPTVVLGSLTLDLTAAPSSVALTTVDPTVIQGSVTVDLTAAPAVLTLTTVDPTVSAGGGITIDLSGAPNAMTLTTVAPTVVLGSVTVDLAAAANSLALATVDPTVINNVTLDLTASPAVLTLTTVNPTVVAGGDITLDLSAVPSTLALTVVDPTVVLGSTTANLAGAPNVLALTTVNPTVTIADAFALPLSTTTIMIRPSAVSAPRRPVSGTTKASTPGAATTLV